MKATLIKEKEGVYSLLDGNRFISTTECKEDTPNKLSLKNCEAIANGYDLDELATKFTKDESYGELNGDLFKGYLFGFQKALEILGDKKFSELDMRISYDAGCNNIDADGGPIDDYNIDFQDTINSLQQTEWDVEVEMFTSDDLKSVEDDWVKLNKPQIDSDGCLILKRIDYGSI